MTFMLSEAGVEGPLPRRESLEEVGEREGLGKAGSEMGGSGAKWVVTSPSFESSKSKRSREGSGAAML